MICPFREKQPRQCCSVKKVPQEPSTLLKLQLRIQPAWTFLPALMVRNLPGTATASHFHPVINCACACHFPTAGPATCSISPAPPDPASQTPSHTLSVAWSEGEDLHPRGASARLQLLLSQVCLSLLRTNIFNFPGFNTVDFRRDRTSYQETARCVRGRDSAETLT